MIDVVRQAIELKRQHPDTIQFFRLGDFTRSSLTTRSWLPGSCRSP